MPTNTLFLGPQAQVWTSDVSDPALSLTSQTFSPEMRSNLNLRRLEQFELDNGQTETVNSLAVIPLADRFLIYASVTGAALVNLQAKDTNGVTTITSSLPTFGTARYPGKILVSTFNLTKVTLTGLANGTTIDFGIFRMI